MKGRLYGIGVGPGDPELLTIKAVNAIEQCDVIAMPKTGDGEKAAFSIVEQYLQNKQLQRNGLQDNGLQIKASQDKELLECTFVMTHDETQRKASRQAAATDIMQALDRGKDVGFITLGDPTTYSTYMYVHDIVTSKGYVTEIIPGITSYSAAAAAFGTALCEGEESLTITPGQKIIPERKIHNEAMQTNKVIMKSGKHLKSLLEQLKADGYDHRTKIACRVSMEDQSLYNSISEYEKSPETDYFTLVIVKEKA